jgi:colicin import membrane protein
MLHVAVLFGLFLQWSHSATIFSLTKAAPKPVKIVEVVAVDESEVQAAIANIATHQRKKQQAEQAALQQIEQQKQVAQKRLADLEAQQKKTAQKSQNEAAQAKAALAELKKQQAEAKKQADQAKQQAAENKKHLDDLQKKTEQAKKQQQLEQQKLAEMEHKKQQALEEQKKKAAEQKRLVDEMFARQLAEDELSLNAARERQVNREVEKYTVLIENLITQHWINPSKETPKVSAKYAIEISPAGDVLVVKLIRSSGNDILDRSVRVAILETAPFPAPEPEIFSLVREIYLTAPRVS